MTAPTIPTQIMALGLPGVQTPLLVDIRSSLAHPRGTVLAIEPLIPAVMLYAHAILTEIISADAILTEIISADAVSEEKLTLAQLNEMLSKHLQDDPQGMGLTGGPLVLLGGDLLRNEIARIVAGDNGEEEPFCGPDSAVYLKEFPEVIFSFHATNNNGGNTYVMRKEQFIRLFPEEKVEEFKQN